MSCLGYTVVHSVYNHKTWQSYSRTALILITFMMFVSVNVLYLTLLLINLDPNWSLSFALQWCVGEGLTHTYFYMAITVMFRSVLDHHNHQRLHRPDDDLWVRPGPGPGSDQPSLTPLSSSLALLARPHCWPGGLGLSWDLGSCDPEEPRYLLPARSPPGAAPSHQQLGLHDPQPDTQDTVSSAVHSEAGQDNKIHRFTASLIQQYLY